MEYDADEILRRMRADTESDWPARLIDDLAAAPSLELAGRERDVLSYASHGLEATHTAELLGTSVYTVKQQLRSARRRLGAKNTVHAVALALRRGLIS